ncbi:MAG TPA: M23 family metallopeptidase [Candidatus Saccharimonadales bacterium]|nr:M23 family metallopeptidase [Candidatus Saccharimonadales bacterium]
MKITNALRGLRTLREIKERPAGFVIDLILSAIISALIPIPFVGSIIARYKKIVVWGIVGASLVSLLLLVLIITMLFSPYSFFFSPSDTVSTAAISSLQNYTEEGFADTDTPQRNPFGGQGMTNTYTTESFHDVEILIINGAPYNGVEQGIDIVPNGLYFLTNKAAKLTQEPIIFDTLTGTTHTYVDPYGALIVEVTNNIGSIKTVYIHMQQILVGNNALVHPGQPIGVMGSTGLSTGPHLEYQVRLYKGGSWVAIDPMKYIH